LLYGAEEQADTLNVGRPMFGYVAIMGNGPSVVERANGHRSAWGALPNWSALEPPLSAAGLRYRLRAHRLV
jgi:hypothetical protein